MVELLALLANRYFWMIAGPLAAALAIYIKAYLSGKQTAEDAQDEVERKLQTRLRATEAKNQFIEQQREKTNDQVDNNSSTIDQLISVFDSLQSDKTTDSDADPKTK